MRIQRGWVACAIAICLFAGAAAAQFPGRQGPPAFRGIWSPTVGAGAAYSIESKRDKSEMEVAVVGTETHQGKSGYWLEMTMKTREGGMVSKMLMVNQENQLQPVRMIMQMEGQEAMEFPMEMMGRMGPRQEPQSSDFRNDAVRVGTESVTVPAGTFSCEHWKSKDGTTDVWIAEKTGPWGLVKSVSKDSTMVLVRATTNATSKIKGTPKKFDMQQMMRQPN